jgi:hypothetical protein
VQRIKWFALRMILVFHVFKFSYSVEMEALALLFHSTYAYIVKLNRGTMPATDSLSFAIK